MTIDDIDPLTDPRWPALLERYRSDVFHSRDWIGVLSRTYDFDLRALVRLAPSGEPVAGLLYSRIGDIFPTRQVSLSFSDFCDPLVRNADDWCALADAWLAAGHGATIRCLHSAAPAQDPRFERVKAALWHAVDIDPDPEAQWRALEGPARRAIRRARKGGLTVRPARPEELRGFFELHLRVRKYKYRLVAQPYRFFEAIWQQFVEEGNGQLLVALHDEEIVGGVLYLRWGDRLYYKFNASDSHYLNLRPNDLLMWAGLDYARDEGLRRLDLGLSDIDQPGLLRYKRKYASEEKEIAFWRAAANTTDMDERAKALRGLLPRLTELLTDDAVPDHITERAGDLLYGYFT